MPLEHYHIAVELIEAIGEYLTAQGHDADAFFAANGVVLDSDESEGYVDFHEFSRLFDAAAVLTGEPCIGLKVLRK